ncbi:Type I restriction-modification system, DNA-methyltransferase subunit M (EC 2.1.1.72) [Methylomonas albis]|uniref:site-specific DNA-methyltransferase (adenine-specific) n=1 Tax=Methylomonas albis TaxID=1854563 RepID=A0ABR9D6S5_9GAMM|nr:N-6 DNA methylase [Methylomonas albis]MBD9358770.1 N-6 DNA methylase [Methylomonas albis]CAD6882226.1 Type I restriction-modification system, DNA-methyltransferase subunit M (EC 2.1.1.72) [Methylomonas albis]
MSNSEIVQKLWNLCDVLRDDGINYSDYVTELVLLLFIKMEYENTEAGILLKHKLPEGCRWLDLTKLSGLNLLNHYRQLLLDLSKSDDHLIAAIYADAQTRLREPRHLEQLIKSLDAIDWFSAKRDGLGDLYEGLLEKNASETKSGAGQYFTPRPLIDSIIRCIRPQAGELIQDPAAGTAGFLIAADAYIKEQTDDLYNLTEKLQSFQRNQAFVGMELVPGTRRLALMNCLLHGMEGDDEGVVHLGNTLGQPGTHLPKADVILTNPPFGTAKGGEASVTRDDFTYKTSNKQLVFLQHIYRSLKPGGRAAVVLPDNVLFEAGVGSDIRRDLMQKCNLHTILRLPTGIFYAQGVKTNVLFFSKGTAENPRQEENCTQQVWVYDLRTNMPSFGKRTPFDEQHLAPFEVCYHAENRQEADGQISLSLEEEGRGEREVESRWRCFSRDWIKTQKGDSLDIAWLKDQDSVDAASLPEPDVLAAEAMSEMTEALRELDGLMTALGKSDEATLQKKMLADILGLEGDIADV